MAAANNQLDPFPDGVECQAVARWDDHAHKIIRRDGQTLTIQQGISNDVTLQVNDSIEVSLIF